MVVARKGIAIRVHVTSGISVCKITSQFELNIYPTELRLI